MDDFVTVDSEPKKKPNKKESSPFKWVLLGVGTLFGVAHIGVLGHLINNKAINYPVIQFPSGDYSSYEVEGNRDGYSIKYRANDPTILESDRSLTLDKHKKGLFGPTTEMRREFRRDQYTMDGTVTWEVQLMPRESLLQKAKSAFGRTLARGHKVRWREPQLVQV